MKIAYTRKFMNTTKAFLNESLIFQGVSMAIIQVCFQHGLIFGYKRLKLTSRSKQFQFILNLDIALSAGNIR